MADLVRRTLAIGLLALAACDGSARHPDASAPQFQRVVSVRVDAPSGGAPTVSIWAFRATLTGLLPGDDLLAVVDPLVAPQPETRCELRDVAGPVRALRGRDGAVDLKALPGVGLDLDGGLVLRPSSRVYPQLGEVVGGVIGEAGPVTLISIPERLTFSVGDARESIPMPELPRLLDQDGNVLAAGSRLDGRGDLMLSVGGPPRSFVEIRPFGAPTAIACPAGPDGRVTVPRDMLERLMVVSGHVPVSFEAVWRESRMVHAGGQPTRLSFEARSSAVLDLRP